MTLFFTRFSGSPPPRAAGSPLAWLAALCLLLSSVVPAWAQTSGIFDGFVVTSVNGGANVFSDMNPQTATANPDFNGGNLGSFGAGNTLVLNGAQLKTFKNSGDDVTSARLQYRIYPYTATPGSFTSINLGFLSNDGGGNQTWQNAGANVNVLNSLTAGIYILEVYGEISTAFAPTTKFFSNNGNNYRAQFTVGTSLINESFEGGLGSMTAVNGAATNKWIAGTGAGASVGSNAAYISNAGTTYAYTTSGAISTVFLYKDVTIPAGETLINLSFAWKGHGNDPTYDYLRVGYAATSFTFPSATTNIRSSAAIPGFTDIHNQLQGLGTTPPWTNFAATLPAALAGTTVRVIFMWSNDNGGGAQPPAALDNIVLTSRAAQPLNGTYTIDNTQVLGNRTFPSFTRAVQALNEDGISGAVTFNVISGQTFDEAPVTLLTTGTAANPITFQRSGATNATLRGTGGTLNGTSTGGDAIFKLLGADYINFNGIDLADNPANANGTTRMENGLLLDGIFATSGCQNNSFKNATITLNKANANTPTGIILRTNGGSLAAANSNNTFRNVTITNAAVGYSFSNGSSSFPDLNNSIDTESGGTSLVNDLGGATLGPVQGVELSNQSGVSIRNTTFRDFSYNSTTYGIGSTTGSATSVTIQNCKFSNIVVSAGSNVGAIYLTAHSTATAGEISNCQIEPIAPATVAVSSTNAGTNIYGIYSTQGSLNIFQNTIRNLSQTTASGTGGNIVGINLTSSSATYNVARNTVHSLSQATASGSWVAGIAVSGTTTNVSNNMISNLRYDRISGPSGVRGISVLGGTTINLYYNTVYLTGTAAVTNHNSTALYLPSSSATVDYRNNIFFNNYTGAGGTVRVVAVEKTSGTVNNPFIATTSNNNLVYGASAILNNSGSLITTLAAYRTTLTGGRESAAVTESTTPFTSSTDPHLTAAVPTQAEAGAVAIASYIDDFDAVNTRLPGSYPIMPAPSNGGGQAPDIGADEGDFTPLDLTPPTITITTSPVNSTSLAAPTIVATITDASGVNTTVGTRPRLYYRLSTNADTYAGNTSANNGWKFVETSSGSSPYSFTPNFALLTSAPVAGSIIQYFVVAQDLATTPNVGISPNNAFTTPPTSVALTAAAFPNVATYSVANKNQYTILDAFTGTINVGPAETITSFTAAGGLFARLNAGALTGNLTVLVTGDITTETGEFVLNPPTEEGVGSYTIAVQPSATTERLITGWVNGLFGVRGITLNGADRVTFDGRFNQTGTTKYLRLRSAVTSAGVFTLIQDATNNVIRDCFIESANTSFSTAAVTFGSSNATPVFNGVAGGVTGNDNNSLLNCEVSPPPVGTLAQGFYSSIPLPSSISNSGCTVSGNNFANFATYGVVLGTSTGSTWTISNNSFYSTLTNTGAQTAIWLTQGTGSYTDINVTGNYIGGSAPLATGTWSHTGNTLVRGIDVSGGSNTPVPSTTVSGNTIQNFSLTGTTSQFQGIRVGNSTFTYAITGNTIADITAGGGGTTGLGSPGVVGIRAEATSSTSQAQAITGNTVRNLSLTNTTTINMVLSGIVVTGFTGEGQISRNRVTGLVSNSSQTGAITTGITLFNGSWTVTNNQVALTNGSNTNSQTIFGLEDNTVSNGTELFYFNTVRIGGSAAAGTLKTYAYHRTVDANTTLRNNILLNDRTGNGSHFALGFGSTSLSSKFVSDYNNLYSANSAQLAENTTTAQTWAVFKAVAPGREANGKNTDVRFADETTGDLNLDTTTNCQLDGTGVVIAGLDGEFDNVATSRASMPDIGSDEFTYVPQTALITTTGPVCGTTPASITLNGGNGPYALTYTDGVTPVDLTNQAGPAVAFSAIQGATATPVTYTLSSATDAYGCALSISGSPLVVNTPAIIDAGPAAATVCVGNSYTLAGTAGGGAMGATWSTSGDGNFAPNATTLGATYTPGTADILAGTVTLTLASTGETAPCTTVTDNLVLTITTTTTWTGAMSTDWYDGGNWSNCVPSALVSAVIPNVVNDPEIALNTATVKDLTIQAGGQLTVGGLTTVLTVNGTFSNAGTYLGLEGTTRLVGDAATVLPTGTYYDVELTGSALKTLSGTANVGHDLTLAGGSLALGSFNLTFSGATGGVLGYSASAFVVTDGTGRLGYSVVGPTAGRGTTVVFPIGTSAAAVDYSPATLSNSGTGTVDDSFTARVADGISRIVMGMPTTITDDAVDKTWDVSEGTPGGTRAALTLVWNQAQELFGFNRANTAISHQVGGEWAVGPFAPAVPLGGGLWARTRGGLTSFSPFGVEDSDRPLPVELTRFSALRAGQQTELTWTTASEQNSKGFEVQVSTRSTDGYRTLGFVASPTANSEGPRAYAFTDREAGKVGLRYYRLRQLDIAGNAHFSAVQAVQFDASAVASVQALPNPFAGELAVEVVATQPGTAQVRLLDALGRVVFAQAADVAAGRNVLMPAVRALPAGAYVLVTEVDGQVFRTRLVKE